MWNKHFQYVVSIVLSVLAVIILVAILSLVVTLIKPESFFVTYSNLVFIAGMLVITFGAFVEFFLRARSPAIARNLLMPSEVLQKLAAFQEMDREKAETDEDKTSGGWMLIFIGILVVVISFVSALIGMKQAI